MYITVNQKHFLSYIAFKGFEFVKEFIENLGNQISNKKDEFMHIYHTFLPFSEITNAYNVLRNLTSRRDYDKEIGTYFTMRGTKKKESGEKVLRLTDEMLEIDMRGIKQVLSAGHCNI